MEVNHATQLAAMQANQTALQNKVVSLERNRGNNFYPNKPNDRWQNQRRPPPQDQRPPNPLESTNAVDHQAIPYCRPCGDFHEENTCQVFLQIINDKMNERTENEQVNMCGQKYDVGMYEWMDLAQNSQRVESINEVAEAAFGPKPSEQQVSDFSKYRGITYQRNGKKNQSQERTPTNVPKVPPPPPISVLLIHN